MPSPRTWSRSTARSPCSRSTPSQSSTTSRSASSMSTRPPTGDDAGAPPPWFPDEATLTRLATEFFGPVPGHEPSQAPESELSDDVAPAVGRPAEASGEASDHDPRHALAGYPAFDDVAG